MDANPSAAAPSGRQYEIRFGRQRAVVVEVGAALRSYTAGDHQILDGFDPDAMGTAARGAPLAPWPNRLHRGQYQWDGATLQAPINEPDKNNALHGYTRGMNWVAADHGAAEVKMTLRLHAQKGYPFVLDLAVRYALSDDGLTVTTTARNVGAKAAPFGYGAHPYLTVGTEAVDDAILHLPGPTYLPTDDNQIPTGRVPVSGTPYDFTTPRRIGAVEMDYAFTDLIRDSDGRTWLELADPDTDRRVKVWADEEFGYLEIFTGDTVPEPQRRRRGLGVEPMTCPPNAFATGEDVRRLEPGEEFVCSWGIVPTPR